MKNNKTTTTKQMTAWELRKLKAKIGSSEYAWLNNAKLRNNAEIQRNLNTSRVAEIVKHFDPRLVNPVKVSDRDGTYNVFDGAHTRAALREIYGKDSFPVFCKIYHDLTLEEEARLFALQQGFSAPVSTNDRIRALAVAKDPEIMDFLSATRQVFRISPRLKSGADNRVAANSAALESYRTLGAALYADMLLLLKMTWGGARWSLSANMIRGMTIFYSTYKLTAADKRRFAKTMREVQKWHIDAVADGCKGSRGAAYAVAIETIYGSRSGRYIQPRSKTAPLPPTA